MKPIRALIAERKLLLMLVFGFALCVKALVPQGYMVASSSKFITVQICSDGSDGLKTAQIEVPFDKGSPDQSDHAAKTSPCAFSSLSMSALGGADEPLLFSALVFILLTAFLPAGATPICANTYLRPPLRGPPVLF